MPVCMAATLIEISGILDCTTKKSAATTAEEQRKAKNTRAPLLCLAKVLEEEAVFVLMGATGLTAACVAFVACFSR